MPRQISEEEARSLGIETAHQEMDNGERRFRLVCSDGCSYVRTEATKESGWQNSHYHKHLTELYVVHSGWMAFAELSPDGELILKHMGQGSMITVYPLVRHNIYMSPFTVTHVIKYGDGDSKVDWFASHELDKLTKHIPESYLVRMNEQ
jgi:oxalate decarboxylase/phosphoglucose isomerase-like protein (cupin superfamily)